MDQYIIAAIVAERVFVDELLKRSEQIKARNTHTTLLYMLGSVGSASFLALIFGILLSTSIVCILLCIVAGTVAHHTINQEELSLKCNVEMAIVKLASTYKWIGFQFASLLEQADFYYTSQEEINRIRQFFSSTTTIYGDEDFEHTPVQLNRDGDNLLSSLHTTYFSEMVAESIERQMKLSNLVPPPLNILPDEDYAEPILPRPNQEQRGQYLSQFAHSFKASVQKIIKRIINNFIPFLKLGLSHAWQAFKNPKEVWNRFNSALAGENGIWGTKCAMGQIFGGLVLTIGATGAALALPFAAAGVATLGALAALFGAAFFGFSTFAASLVPKGGIALVNFVSICDLISTHLNSFKEFLSNPIRRYEVYKIGSYGILTGSFIGFVIMDTLVTVGLAQSIINWGHIFAQVIWLSLFSYGYYYKGIVKDLVNNLTVTAEPFDHLFESLRNGNIDQALPHLKVIHEKLNKVRAVIPDVGYLNLNVIFDSIIDVSHQIIVFGDSMENATDIEHIRNLISTNLKSASVFYKLPIIFKSIYFKWEAYATSSLFWITLFCSGEIVMFLVWLFTLLLLEVSTVSRLGLISILVGISLFGFRYCFEWVITWAEGQIKDLLDIVDSTKEFFDSYTEYCVKTQPSIS